MDRENADFVPPWSGRHMGCPGSQSANLRDVAITNRGSAAGNAGVT